jgi:hypothetical protein
MQTCEVGVCFVVNNCKFILFYVSFCFVLFFLFFKAFFAVSVGLSVGAHHHLASSNECFSRAWPYQSNAVFVFPK